MAVAMAPPGGLLVSFVARRRAAQAIAELSGVPRLITLIHDRFIDIKAFTIPEHLDTYPEFLAEVTPLVADGRIKYSEEFVDGFENIPEAFLRLFDGNHLGKLIVRVGRSA